MSTDATTGLRDVLLGERSVAHLLSDAASRDPLRRYATHGDRSVSVGELQGLVDQTVEWLSAAGVGSGSRVVVGADNSIDHVAVIFALFDLDALWVPLNPRLRGDPLAHLLRDCAATHVVATEASAVVGEVSRLGIGLTAVGPGAADVRSPGPGDGPIRILAVPPGDSGPDVAPEVCAVMYTSGTTGPAKGVQVTDSMLRGSALGAFEVMDARPGDVLYVWEPIFHIGGAQVLVLPLVFDVSLAFSSRFSATRFWSEVAASGATHIHYLGGILQMLLAQRASKEERAHRVRVAWGAGLPEELWERCSERFGLELHECYGMTETASIVSVNRSGPSGGAGFPLPWFDIRIDSASTEGVGEILVRGRVPGLITPGYLGNEEATRRSRRSGWFRTGDLGILDADSRLHFRGRANDSVRVRGENVSAWQVESVFDRHPDVETCAVVGVAADVGEQELLLYVVAPPERAVDPQALVEWSRQYLPDFQVPRYVQVVDSLPLTPSRRVAKGRLERDVSRAVDTRRRLTSAARPGVRETSP